MTDVVRMSMMPTVGHAKGSMRDPEIIETELMEISAIADDIVKFERIVTWCATHPDEASWPLIDTAHKAESSRPI